MSRPNGIAHSSRAKNDMLVAILEAPFLSARLIQLGVHIEI